MSNVINASGKTLTNTGTGAVYAPSTGYSSPNISAISASPNAVAGSYGINNNLGSAYNVAMRQPGLGSFLGNKNAEDSGEIRAFNNNLAQYLMNLSWERNLSSARETNAFNQQMMQDANAFNRSVMKDQMEFQKYMSNTAHQREVADLVAAGLNPVISANNGAVTPSGSALSSATAHGTSANSPMASVDTNQYAANSLMSVLTNTIAEFLTNRFGSNVVTNTAKKIENGAKNVIKNVSNAINSANTIKNNENAYSTGNYEVYDPDTNTFSKGKPKSVKLW